MRPIPAGARTLFLAVVACALLPTPAGRAAPPAGGSAAASRGAGPQPVVALEDFVEALAPHGTWVEHRRWGRVWRPKDVGPDWKPYFRGRWARTDLGWYWVSEEPWGWATYHFGRWFLDPLEGWIWVPGRGWAPAWVAWRVGKRLAGWAPIGPDGKVFAPAHVFVPLDRIEEPPDRVALPEPRTARALGETHAVGEKPGPAPARLDGQKRAPLAAR